MDEIVRLLTTRDGRISRKRWWIGVLFILVIGIALSLVLALITGGSLNAMAWGNMIIGLALLYPAYSIGVKRRHDRGDDGKDLLALMVASIVLNLLQTLGIGVTMGEVGGVPVPVPDMWLMVLQLIFFVFGLYMLVQLGFLKGTAGPNQYGPDPLA